MFTIKVFSEEDGKLVLEDEAACKGFAMLLDNVGGHTDWAQNITALRIAEMMATSEIFMSAAPVAEGMIKGKEYKDMLGRRKRYRLLDMFGEDEEEDDE